MLAKQKCQTSSKLVKSILVPLTQLSFSEPAGQGGYGECGPSGNTSPAPTLDKSLKSDRSQCPVRALRYYMDLRSQAEQGVGLGLL